MKTEMETNPREYITKGHPDIESLKHGDKSYHIGEGRCTRQPVLGESFILYGLGSQTPFVGLHIAKILTRISSTHAD